MGVLHCSGAEQDEAILGEAGRAHRSPQSLPLRVSIGVSARRPGPRYAAGKHMVQESPGAGGPQNSCLAKLAISDDTDGAAHRLDLARHAVVRARAPECRFLMGVFGGIGKPEGMFQPEGLSPHGAPGP